MRILAMTAILPAGATLYFILFWRWFDHWRKHRVATYSMMLGTFVVLGVAVHRFRSPVFACQLEVPWWLAAIGWVVAALACLLGFVADRQIGIRVRSFTPFFETQGRIVLETRGAYAIVRHPIYAAGIAYQLGVLLITGYLAVGLAWVVLTLGALWFTRQEERRLMELLEDPGAYERYRSRVPGLFPWFKRGGSNQL